VEANVFDDDQPRHTRIQKVISVPAGKAILEDHTRHPPGESNLYFVAENGELVWQAERPTSKSLYIRVKLNQDGRTLSAYTTDSTACEIDIKSGKLLSQIAFQ
jgi:hypothetical protein